MLTASGAQVDATSQSVAAVEARKDTGRTWARSGLVIEIAFHSERQETAPFGLHVLLWPWCKELPSIPSLPTRMV